MNKLNTNLRNIILAETENESYVSNINQLFQNGGKNIIKGLRYENNTNIVNSDTSSEMYGGKKINRHKVIYYTKKQ